MRTLQIEKVSVIRHNKAGEVINVVAIRIPNKPAILRSFDQFITDLQDSFLVLPHVNSMNHPEVLDVLADLQGGTVTGDISFHKAGDPYKIDENHPALTNPNHRLYGKVVAGQPMKAEKDGSRVTEGFLTLKRDITAFAIQKQANSYASQRLALEGFLRSINSDTPAGNAPTDTDDFEIETVESVKAEVIGEGK
jgi:hypothetical protein